MDILHHLVQILQQGAQNVEQNTQHPMNIVNNLRALIGQNAATGANAPSPPLTQQDVQQRSTINQAVHSTPFNPGMNPYGDYTVPQSMMAKFGVPYQNQTGDVQLNWGPNRIGVPLLHLQPSNSGVAPLPVNTNAGFWNANGGTPPVMRI